MGLYYRYLRLSGYAELLPMLLRNLPETILEPRAWLLGRGAKARKRQPGRGCPLGAASKQEWENDVFP